MGRTEMQILALATLEHKMFWVILGNIKGLMHLLKKKEIIVWHLSIWMDAICFQYCKPDLLMGEIVVKIAHQQSLEAKVLKVNPLPILHMGSFWLPWTSSQWAGEGGKLLDTRGCTEWTPQKWVCLTLPVAPEPCSKDTSLGSCMWHELESQTQIASQYLLLNRLHRKWHWRL